MRIRRKIALSVLTLALTAGVLGWILWPSGKTTVSQQVVDATAVEPILGQLVPGSTYHIAGIHYRRYGGEASQIPASEGPDTQRGETWITFDSKGALAQYRAETRDMSGRLVGSEALDGNDLVSYAADGSERHRTRDLRGKISAAGLGRRLAAAVTQERGMLAAHPDAPTANVAGRATIVVENRHPYQPARVGVGTTVTGFQLPYVADLDPVEEIRRSYILPDEDREVRSETVIVSRNGTETVVESREYEVFEVLPPS